MKTFVYLALSLLATVAVAQESAKSNEPQSTPGISVLKFVAPRYPPIARIVRIQGDVRLLVEVASDGSAKNVTVISGHPMLSYGVTDALKQWRFGCQRCDGELRHVVIISFELDDTLPAECGSKPAALRCVEPRLPSRLIVRDRVPRVETSTYRIREPITLNRQWPGPISESPSLSRPVRKP
jgi:TonB family protein